MINLTVANAQQALDMKQQVIDHGLMLDRDFTWEYVPNQYDGWDAETQTSPLVTFKFVDSTMETFFQLRWS